MQLWKKALAAATAGVLCLGSVGVSGLQNVLESVGTMLSVSAAVPDEYSGIYDEKLYYNVTDDGEIAIVGCAANAITADIPETIADKPVTSIAAKAFEGCQNLQSVTIPNTIKKVGENAFFNCTKLKYGVNITDLEAWCRIAFGNFRGNPLSYGAPLHLNGSALETVTIPYSITTIGANTFSGCSSIRKVIMHSGVIGIDSSAFWHCVDLSSVTIPNGVTYIGASAFAGCSSLKEIAIPDTLQRLENSVFSGCTALTSITIPDSVTYIRDAFTGCTGLTEVTIPSAVTVVESGAFGNCTNLKDVTFENYKTRVEYNAFMNCQPDVHFTVPDTFDPAKESSTVGNHVTHLTVQHQDGEIPASAYQEMAKLREVTLENDIATIGENAFASCTELEKIVIPRSVTEIAYTAFTYDTKLTIYGYRDSYAEKYAEMLMFPFVELEEPDTPPVTTTTPAETLPAESTTTEVTTSTESTASTTGTTTATTGTTTTTTTTQPTPAAPKGDLDGSGSIDSTDIYYALYYVANIAVGNDGGLTPEQIAAADVDGSGSVDSTDIYYMLYYVSLHGAGIHQTWEEILAK